MSKAKDERPAAHFEVDDPATAIQRSKELARRTLLERKSVPPTESKVVRGKKPRPN